jgi:hypothetical protein
MIFGFMKHISERVNKYEDSELGKTLFRGLKGQSKCLREIHGRRAWVEAGKGGRIRLLLGE